MNKILLLASCFALGAVGFAGTSYLMHPKEQPTITKDYQIDKLLKQDVGNSQTNKTFDDTHMVKAAYKTSTETKDCYDSDKTTAFYGRNKYDMAATGFTSEGKLYSVFYHKSDGAEPGNKVDILVNNGNKMCVIARLVKDVSTELDDN